MIGVEVSERRPTAAPAPAPRRRSLGAVLRRHWPVAAVLVAAALLRVIAEIAIYPGIWFSDANNYAQVAATGTLSVVRVQGYALVLTLFWHLGSAGALIILQHLLALGIVVALYALLVRRGVPRWLATLAVVPAALDAYLIAIEHAIMSDTIFHTAVVGAIVLLLWWDRPGLAAAAGAGLLLGYAGVVRSVGAPFFVVFLVYLLLRRLGWRTVVVFCVGWALVNGAYLTLYDVQHGQFAYTGWSGRFLYSRVATFADCSRIQGLPANERALCPNLALRMTPNGYLWGHSSPIYGLPLNADPRIRDFSMRVIRSRPTTYARSVGSEFLHFFEPGHRVSRDDITPATWQFPTDPATPTFPGYRGPIRNWPPKISIDPNRYVRHMVRAGPRTNATASRLLHGYQRFFFTSGQLLAICLVVVIVAVFLRRVPWRFKLDAALLAAATVAALVVAAALSMFSYRYGLIAVLLLPAAAAMAVTGMLRRQPKRSDLTQTS